MTARWHKRKKEQVVELRFDSFINDIISVYRAHNLSLGHEDEYGAFIIQPPSEENEEWLKHAHVGKELE